MLRIRTLIVCLALATAIGGCGGPDVEDMTEELADVYNDMADVIEGISDDESIEKASTAQWGCSVKYREKKQE